MTINQCSFNPPCGHCPTCKGPVTPQMPPSPQEVTVALPSARRGGLLLRQETASRADPPNRHPLLRHGRIRARLHQQLDRD